MEEEEETRGDRRARERRLCAGGVGAAGDSIVVAAPGSSRPV